MFCLRCWDRVPFFVYPVCITSMILHTARCLCILYAEMCINMATGCVLFIIPLHRMALTSMRGMEWVTPPFTGQLLLDERWVSDQWCNAVEMIKYSVPVMVPPSRENYLHGQVVMWTKIMICYSVQRCSAIIMQNHQADQCIQRLGKLVHVINHQFDQMRNLWFQKVTK